MSNIILLGDQTAEQYPLLRKIVLRKDNALIINFLERCSVVLRHEVQSLPRRQRDMVPDFLSVTELIEAYRQAGHRVLPIETALLTISQLGHYIGYFAENPAKLPSAQDTR